jgi:hypothetical protein
MEMVSEAETPELQLTPKFSQTPGVYDAANVPTDTPLKKNSMEAGDAGNHDEIQSEKS